MDLQDQIRDSAMRYLKHKGYAVHTTSETGGASDISEDDLKSASSQWIGQLPSDERFVMVLVLVDVKTQLTFGSTGNAEVAGAVFDKVKGTTVWRDKGIGKVGHGGLLGMAFKELMDEDAIRFAMRSLMASIPDVKDKRPRQQKAAGDSATYDVVGVIAKLRKRPRGNYNVRLDSGKAQARVQFSAWQGCPDPSNRRRRLPTVTTCYRHALWSKR